MTRRQAVLMAALAAAAALVLWLALGTRQAPILPGDPAHAVSAGPAPCLACHGAAGVSPRGRNHPLGDDCLRCHGVRG
jgi:hypothetical protein